jgi:hypothetical protein
MPHIIKEINVQQHGFLPGRSTLTNLSVYESYIAKCMSRRLQVDCIYTDFQKAFDKVCHSILLQKMHIFGFQETLLNWFETYLSGRTLQVMISDRISRSFNATSGLPQGSHFGPILFLIFINDVTDVFEDVEFLLFADDIKLYRCIRCERDCLALQGALDGLSEWCRRNRLFLSVAKCQYISFTRNRDKINFSYQIDGVNLDVVKEVRDLGIIFDDRLSFVNHVTDVSGRAMKSLGFMLRTVSGFKNVNTLKLLFITTVRSILEYNSPIWSPCFTIHKKNLERIQKKFLRYVNFVLNIPRIDLNYDFLYALVQLEKLESRRVQSDLMFLFKIINGLCDSPNLVAEVGLRVGNRSTRNNNTFYIDNSFNTTYLRNSVVPRLHYLGNQHLTDIDIFCTSLQSFKQKIKLTFTD